MEAGKLNKSVTFEREVQAVRLSGSVASTWTPYLTVRAEVREMQAEEIALGFGQGQRDTKVFVVRWHPSPITTGDRVIYAGRAYDIRNIADLGRSGGWKIIGVSQ